MIQLHRLSLNLSRVLEAPTKLWECLHYLYKKKGHWSLTSWPVKNKLLNVLLEIQNSIIDDNTFCKEMPPLAVGIFLVGNVQNLNSQLSRLETRRHFGAIYHLLVQGPSL